jgi:hypothetical protein
MLMPWTMRVPGDRFFFGDAVSCTMLPFAETTEDDRAWAREFLDAWLHRPRQPQYMKVYGLGYKAFRRQWLKELAIGLFRPELDRDDATLLPLPSRFADRVTRWLNALACHHLPLFDKPAPGERYVLYPLHHQPEASVDVSGSLNSNQTALIETLSRLLPVTHKLWIKEHRSGIGDRSLGWYRRISRLPNVRLLDPWQDIFSLIKGADLVVTITGTAGYEAALMGVPSVGLAEMFFSPLLDNRATSRSHALEWQMQELFAKGRTAPDSGEARARIVEFLAQLHANSYAAGVVNLLVPPKVFRCEPDYMKAEVAGFLRFVAGYRARCGVAARHRQPQEVP